MTTERATPVEIDLPVYTGIFKLQRRLYRVYDVELPMPLSFPQAAAFLVVAAMTFVVLRAAGVEFSPGTAWAFLVPPGLAAWLANRPVSDHRAPLHWAWAQVRYTLEPRSVTALGSGHGQRRAALSVAVWERKPKAAKTPKPPKPPKAPKPRKAAKAEKPPKPATVKAENTPQPEQTPKSEKVKAEGAKQEHSNGEKPAKASKAAHARRGRKPRPAASTDEVQS